MTRFRLRPIVSEWDGKDLWVAALPAGPITWIGGVGVLALEALAAPADKEEFPPTLHERDSAGPAFPAKTVDDLLTIIRADIYDAPADADVVLTDFLTSLEASGIVEISEGGTP